MTDQEMERLFDRTVGFVWGFVMGVLTVSAVMWAMKTVFPLSPKTAAPTAVEITG